MSEERKIYDFVGVGLTLEEEEEKAIVSSRDTPIGIATPLRISRSNSSLFAMNTDISNSIKDNLRNLISTNHGERLMLSDFGANLLPLAYELGTESADTAAIGRITRAVTKFMPYVQLGTFEPIREPGPDGKTARVGVKITFAVPVLNIHNQTLEVVVLSVQ